MLGLISSSKIRGHQSEEAPSNELFLSRRRMMKLIETCFLHSFHTVPKIVTMKEVVSSQGKVLRRVRVFSPIYFNPYLQLSKVNLNNPHLVQLSSKTTKTLPMLYMTSKVRRLP